MNVLHVALAATNTVQRITGDATKFNSAVFFGYKSMNATGGGVNNTAPIFVGPSSGAYPIAISTGGYFNWSNIQDKEKDSLSNYYFVGQQNDGVYVVTY